MIKLKNVTKKFGDFEAVKNINLKIPRGEIFGFLGPNGAGKTTTIKMIAGILKSTQGQIFIKNFEISKNPVEAKRVLGYIPDDPFLYERLNGLEFLKFVGDLFQIPKGTLDKKINEALEIFPIRDILERPLREYSRGNRQRITILAAIIHEPEVLLIDEPVVGLDPLSIKTIKELFKQYAAKKGLTIFMSTHTLSIAEELCQRIGIIHKGNLTALGTINQLKQKASLEKGTFEQVYLKLTSDTLPDRSKT